MNKFVVLVPFRNAKDYIIDCVNSLINLQYPNFDVYLLDDASDDGTLDLIDEDFPKLHKIRNRNRLGAVENIFKNLVDLPIFDDDIVVLLDGDDCILGEYAFHIVNDRYQSNILLTYGQFLDSYGRVGFCSPYSKKEFDNLRNEVWKASHLKTFKYKLFKAFLKQDPEARYLKTHNNKFFEATYDQAMMYSFMEIAGFENTSMISNILYYYRLHRNNDHATPEKKEVQFNTELDIRSRIPLQRMF